MEPTKEIKKKVRIFNVIDLTKANERASKTVRIARKVNNQKKIEKKVQSIQNNTINKQFEAIALNPKELEQTNTGSIQKFLNECHTDIRKFIHNNEILKVVAQPGTLIVTTRNRFTVTINIISTFVKSFEIKDKRGNILFKGNQKVSFKKIAA